MPHITRGGEGGPKLMNVTLSILLFLCPDKKFHKKLVVLVKTYLSRKKSDVKDKTGGCCFAFNITKVMWWAVGHYRNTTDYSHTACLNLQFSS